MNIVKKVADKMLLKQKETCCVFELFTSQGCSSCPPAEANMKKIVELSKNLSFIFPLEFHVHYWNGHGWEDPLSSETFTKRQQVYARMFNERQIYTPQMIINGREHFVGSDFSKLQSFIHKYKNKDHSSGAQLLLEKTSPAFEGKMKFKYKLSNFDFFHPMILNIAYLQSNVSNHISAGENSGKTLSHSNVVRRFLSQKIEKPEGHITFDLKYYKLGIESEIISYVQDPKTMIVLAATRYSLYTK